MRNDWSDAERKIIRKIYKSGKKIVSQSHLLPNRCARSIRAEAARLGIKKSPEGPMRPRVEKLMADGVDRTAKQIGEALKVKHKYILDVMRAFIAEEKAHILEYTGSYHQALYRFGPGVNAEMPETVNNRRSMLRLVHKLKKEGADGDIDEKVLDEAHRGSGSWWPQADPIVCGAMRAMVEAGRAA